MQNAKKLSQMHRSLAGKRDAYSVDVRQSIEWYLEGENIVRLPSLMLLGSYPVTVEEFIFDKKYLGRGQEVWPKVMDSIIEINNPAGDRLGQKYYESVLTGGIGTAKTTRALYTTAYQLYLLSCYRSPHVLLNQDKVSEIYFVFQSLNARVARDVDYARFRNMIEGSEYFNTVFPYRKDLDSRLVFPKNISVFPTSGDTSATIGQNVYGGFIDEVNFMEVIEGSRRLVDGGQFNQAIELYNSIASRRESRFMRQGVVPGILCLGSSKNYPGQFTDRKAAEAVHDDGIYYRDEVIWDVKPAENFTDKWFHVFVGSDTKKPYIINPPDAKQVTKDFPNQVKRVPLEYKKRFVNDIYNALREIAGVSTVAKAPYFPNVEALNKNFDTKVTSIFSRDECDFDRTSTTILKDALREHHRPRFCHIDLGLTSDAAGFCIGYVDKFVHVEGDEEDTGGMMPHIRIDGFLRVTPPINDEINFAKIRTILYRLTQLGVTVRWVTFDSYQSVDSQQILRGKGYMTGTQSMDKTPLPYDLLKNALNQGRVSCPDDAYLRNEIIHLERTDKGKIDHNAYNTKDLADAFAGVVYGLTMQRWTWASFGVQPSPMITSQFSQERDREG
jgi:hypothetical protein